jgi:hypothetical protein
MENSLNILLTYNPHLTVYTHRKHGTILLNEIHQISLLLSLTIYTRTKPNVHSVIKSELDALFTS